MINSSSYRTFYIKTITSYAETDKPVSKTNYRKVITLIAKNNLLLYMLHVCTWAGLYVLPFALFSACNATTLVDFFKPANPAYFLSYSLLIIFSYLNYYWLLPVLFKPGKKINYFLLVITFIAAIIACQFLASIAFSPVQSVFAGLNYTSALLMVSVFATVYMQQEKNNENAIAEVAKIKLSQLNSQVNAHFLFNSLNWIYMLAITESKQTPSSIIQLSGMMRHILHAPDADYIDLKKELAYINDYILLQKGRLGDTVSINYSLPAYKEKGKIAPLLLMSFIENAFKHGVNPNEDSVINIDISITGNKICAQVLNNKVSSFEKAPGSGTGIKNAQERLNMLYPSMHQLEILEDNKIYSVKLSMNIQ